MASEFGVVASFDATLAFGEITGDRGQTYFFHCTQIANGSRRIEVGARVTFRVMAGRLGRWEAAEVAEHTPSARKPDGDRESQPFFACPVCDNAVEGESGAYEICGVCNWEDDPTQRNDSAYRGGANVLSLDEARRTWVNKQS
jgi:cold shock CspA family protein